MREITVRGRPVAVHAEAPVEESGEPDLVLVHGAGFDHNAWRFQTRALASRGHRVFALDLPGHGRSDGPPLEAIDDMAGWLGEVLVALGCRDVVLVGHSMGSLVVLECATSAPESILGIVLLSPSDRMQVHPELLQAAFDQNRHAIDLMVGWMHTGIHRYGGHLNAGSWSAGMSRALLERNLSVLGVDLKACEAHDPTIAASQLRTPSLVVTGAADRMTPPAAGSRLASLIEVCECVMLDGAGHQALYEQSADVNREIARFVSGLGGGR